MSRCDVFLALPVECWEGLKCQATATQNDEFKTFFDQIEEKKLFDMSGEDWVWVHWHQVYWTRHDTTEIELIENFMAEDNAFEFVRLGYDHPNDYDHNYNHDGASIFSLRPTVDVMVS